MHLNGFENVSKGITPTNNSTRGIVGFRANITTGGPVMMSVMNSGSLYHFSLFHDPSGNRLQIFRGSAGGPDPTLICTTGPGVVSIGSWYYIECRYYIHPTAGEIEIHVNGISQLNLAGLNTPRDPVFLTDHTNSAIKM